MSFPGPTTRLDLSISCLHPVWHRPLRLCWRKARTILGRLTCSGPSSLSPMFEINDVPEVFDVESFEHAFIRGGTGWLVLVCDTRLLPGALC